MTNNIFLLGYMGSGKTTIGKKLANDLQMDFVDLDDFIESNEDMSIADIFSSVGENEFRNIESKYLKQLLQEKTNTLFALGGGTPCFLDNMKLIKDNGLSIYLKVSATELQQRLQNDIKKRPLIQDLEDEEYMEFIQQQMGQRENFYLQADIISVDGDIDKIKASIKNDEAL